MIDFKASEKLDLTPSNADAFTECMEKISKMYAYDEYICQFPTPMTVYPYGTVTLGDHANLIETCNRIGIDNVLRNANMKWGDNSFTDITPH